MDVAGFAPLPIAAPDGAGSGALRFSEEQSGETAFSALVSLRSADEMSQLAVTGNPGGLSVIPDETFSVRKDLGVHANSAEPAVAPVGGLGAPEPEPAAPPGTQNLSRSASNSSSARALATAMWTAASAQIFSEAIAQVHTGQTEGAVPDESQPPAQPIPLPIAPKTSVRAASKPQILTRNDQESAGGTAAGSRDAFDLALKGVEGQSVLAEGNLVSSARTVSAIQTSQAQHAYGSSTAPVDPSSADALGPSIQQQSDSKIAEASPLVAETDLERSLEQDPGAMAQESSDAPADERSVEQAVPSSVVAVSSPTPHPMSLVTKAPAQAHGGNKAFEAKSTGQSSESNGPASPSAIAGAGHKPASTVGVQSPSESSNLDDGNSETGDGKFALALARGDHAGTGAPGLAEPLNMGPVRADSGVTLETPRGEQNRSGLDTASVGVQDKGPTGGTNPYAAAAALQGQRPVGRQLAIAIGKTMHDGKEQLRISLEPKDLGQLDVRLSVERNGELRAVVTASSDAAAELLRQDMPSLVRSLTDAGLKVDGSSIRLEVQAEARGNSQHRSQQEQPEHHARNSASAAENQFIEEELYAMRPLRAGSQIEMRA